MKLTNTVRTVLACAALAVGVAGCSDSTTAPSSVAFSQTDVKVGTGTEAVSGSTATVNYTGWFYDSTKTDKKGVQFDSSIGGEALTFTVGAGTVIKGWDQGVVGMKVGGIRRLVIPPSLAYGGTRYVSIPPNTTLLFDVELLDVQ